MDWLARAVIHPPGVSGRINFSRVHHEDEVVGDRYKLRDTRKTDAGVQLGVGATGIISMHYPEQWGCLYSIGDDTGKYPARRCGDPAPLCLISPVEAVREEKGQYPERLDDHYVVNGIPVCLCLSSGWIRIFTHTFKRYESVLDDSRR